MRQKNATKKCDKYVIKNNIYIYMNHQDLLVKSNYLQNDQFKFYIKNFKSIINYFYLANNYNKYYLIITNENENDILNIKTSLNDNKKNPEFNKENLFFICSNEEQMRWCIKYEFNYQLDNNKIISFNDLW